MTIRDKPLALEEFLGMEKFKVFDKGLVLDNTPDFNFSGEGVALKWVAVKGYIDDWAVYIGDNKKTFEEIGLTGDKITMERNIRHLVPCTDAVFKKYRF